MDNYSLIEKLLFPPTSLKESRLSASITGKTILITGASSGIGEKLAYKLSTYNVHLILVARRKEKLFKIKNDIEKSRAKVSLFIGDLRDELEMIRLIQFIEQQVNGVHIFVSNAGHSIQRSIFDSLNRFHDFKRTMAINYFAPVQLLLSILPILQKNNGQIINISTINTALIPMPRWSAYQASKTAFDTWFRSVAPELNARDIRTTSIYLPLVRTPMIEATIEYNKMPAMNAEHVSQIICKSMYTKKRVYQPWWLVFLSFASFIFRRPWDKLGQKLYRNQGERQ